MWELERFRSIEDNAGRLFPQHDEISYLAFNRAKFRYFNLIKPMPTLEKILYFEQTYYSHNGICWFILNKTRYFCLSMDIGTWKEYRYCGTTTFNFNP